MRNLLIIFTFFLASCNLFAQDVLEIPGTPPDECPMEGRVSNKLPEAKQEILKDLNRHKNRYTIPGSADYDSNVTLEKMIGDGSNDEGKFDNSKAATIEGYVIYVSKSGSVETCNCKTKLSGYQDTHIELAVDPDEAKGEKTVIVEVTPRLRLKMGPDWAKANLQKLMGKRIRVSGWLNYDVEHEPQARNIVGAACEQYSNKRQTCWEIHPITSWEEVPVSDTVELPEIADLTTDTLIIQTDKNNPTTPSKPTQTMNPINTKDMLYFIILGAILGMAGQVIRVVSGIAKAKNNATPSKPFVQQNGQLLLSLLIALIIGGIAGVLAGMTSSGDMSTIDRPTMFLFLTAGYSGTDFIEGFIKKNPIAEPQL